MTYTLYGISNCDTVKKARKQLDNQGTDYTFIDLKTTELTAEQLSDWLSQQPDTLINKRSTTFRAIKTAWLDADNDETAQIQLIQANPTLIKRPVLEKANQEIIVGFDTKTYQEL